MKNNLKRYIAPMIIFVAAVLSLILAIIVSSIFKSEYSWAEKTASPDYNGFFTSATQFAILIPLVIAVAVFLLILTLELLLSEKIKAKILGFTSDMKLWVRIITYVLLLLITALLIYFEYTSISMVYVVWKGQFQSMWNSANVSTALWLWTPPLVILVYAFINLIRSEHTKE